MAYLAILSQPIRELSPINKSIIQIRNIKSPYKHSANRSSILPSPDPGSKFLPDSNTKFPEPLTYEKKQIHTRKVISKSRTLPYIKFPETEPEVKVPEKTILEPCPTLKNKVKISIKNHKIKDLLKPSQQHSPKIEIVITTCENPAPSVSSKYASSKLPNSGGSSPCDRPYNKSSKRSATSSVLLPCSIIKRHMDPYHYFNYVKHTNVTPFFQLLEGLTDTIVPAYPYMIKILKCFPKLKPSTKTLKESKAKSQLECSCGLDSQVLKKVRLPKIKEIKLLVSSLKLEQFSPQFPVFSDCFVVVNFESVVGCFRNELCVKPGILVFIKKLSKYFRIVLVHSLGGQKADSVISFFQEKGVLLSAVYRTLNPAQDFWEMRNMQDYTNIFKDFDVRAPENKVLVICAHRVADTSDNLNEAIIEKRGLSTKLNIERVPIPLQGFERPPITVLVQNFAIRKHGDIFRRILADLKEFRNTGEDADFRKILLGKEHFECDKIHRILSECFKGFRKGVKSSWKVKDNTNDLLFCKLHNKKIKDFKEKFCDNVFIT